MSPEYDDCEAKNVARGLWSYMLLAQTLPSTLYYEIAESWAKSYPWLKEPVPEGWHPRATESDGPSERGEEPTDA